ncbi:MAG: hypothetical protein Q7T71_11860, partial [Herbiconiux sp.]|nr:hypothetical protein [Herbiconiux sp.]
VAGVLTGAAVAGGAPDPASFADGTTAPTADPTDASTAPDAPDTIVRAMAQVEPGWLDADLAVTPKGWGTRFDWDCSYRDHAAGSGYGDGPTTYDLVVTDTDGSETTVASWTASGGGAAGNLSASTSIATADISSVDIRVSGTDRPLVRTGL